MVLLLVFNRLKRKREIFQIARAIVEPVQMNSSSYSVVTNPDGTVQVCFNKTISHGSALWVENSLETTLPAFVLQFAIILALNRFFLLLAESFHVPRIVANIFTGFLFGPSALGRWNYFFKNILPYSNMLPIETMGAVTLVYYVFLVGLEVDLKPITRCYNKKAMVIAIVATVFTFPVGVGLYYLLVTDMGRKAFDHVRHINGAILWGITLSCSTEFPEIAKILSDLKLLLTENGQLALASSLVNDLFSGTLFLLALTHFYYSSVLLLFLILVIVFVCFFALPPIVKRLINKIGTGDREFLESQVVFLLHIVLVIGLFSDGLGSNASTGAFFLGVIIPKGAFNNAVRDKVFDFVSVFMMPLFFVGIGARIKIQELVLDTHWTTVVIVIVLAFMAKIVCTFAVSWIYQMPLKEGLSLALLVNTKGTMPLLVLYCGRDRLDLDHQTYGAMLLACWLMTGIMGPVLAYVTKTVSTRKFVGSQRKTMQGTRPDSPLRVLACVHTKRDSHAILNLLKASSPSVRCPIQVLAMELIKMANRPASSFIIREARKPSFCSKSSKVESFKKDNGGGGDNLKSFDNLSQAIFAEKLRVVSDYNTMHKDILNLTRRRRGTLILTTLYKQPTYDGLGAGAATARAVNIINRDHASKDEKKIVLENLVKEAPCCLAILVDRGFGEKRAKEKRIAMFYVGGEDDREALSYAWRMSRNMEVRLTVVRLVWDNPEDGFDENDREYLREFVQQAMDTPRVRYLEKVVKDEKETVTLLNKIGNKGFDLYIVGRGHGRKMSLAQTVEPVLEEPALGPLGDTLSDLNSSAETSILIFQRHAVEKYGDDDDDSGKHVRSASAQFVDSLIEQQLMIPQPAYPAMIFSHYA